MDASLLQPSTVVPLDRSTSISKIIDEDDIASYYLSYGESPLSPSFNDDFPTPKGTHLQRSHVPAPIRTAFDELYDVSEDESERCPLTCSQSVKFSSQRTPKTPRSARTPKTPKSGKPRYPSLIIPSPSAWPTIEKYQKQAAAGLQPSPMPILTPSHDVLSKLAARKLEVPSRNATPSLDGSLTADELSEHSCPSTPATPQRHDERPIWSAGPVQLHPDAMLTLHRLSGDDVETQAKESLSAVHEEMQEVRQEVSITVTPSEQHFDPAELSALSIPSPGGFFSSLGDNARDTWGYSTASKGEINTGTAENFYNLPWEAPATEKVVQQVVEVSHFDTDSSAPSTARRVFSPYAELDEVTEITAPSTIAQLEKEYEKEVEVAGSLNLDRTSDWLSSQMSYLSNLLKEHQTEEVERDGASPTTHMRKDSGANSDISRTKSVRFADAAPSSPKKTGSKDTTFLEGFNYIRENTHQNDQWNHRRERAEALHLDRLCLARSHREQLMGNFHLNAPVRPAPARPVSSFYSADPTVQKEQIELAQKERQALELMKPISWNIEATKMLNGGGLLTSPTGKSFPKLKDGRVLDLGGQSSCDWAWEVATQYPKSHVYTVFTEDQKPTMDMEGPENHHSQVVPNMWTLPYPSNHFDVISARSLYAKLKTDKPLGQSLDEYDLCLKEALRCLKPGGYLEFSLLDADILRSKGQTSSVSAEFCFSLRNRGYDPYPTKSFLPRLRKAGFGEMKRAWLALPMTQINTRSARRTSFDVEDLLPRPSIDELVAPAAEDTAKMGSTADASFIAGLVGAWAWERWMLKLQLEMGKEEERLLEGVAAALEEGAGSGAAWRYLSGWARKPFSSAV